MDHGTSQPRRATRVRRGRLLGGVCVGLAAHLGWSVAVVRVLFVLAALMGGFGVVLYAAYWAWLPISDGPEVPAREGGRDLAGVLGLGALAVGFLLVVNGGSLGSWLTPVVLAGVGVAVLWRQSDDSRRSELLAEVGASARATTATAVRRDGLRIALGLTLVVLGLVAALASRGDVLASLRALAAALLAVAGLAIVLLPFVLGWWRDLAAERRGRIRSEERAEVAAQVHDSVLQTLTLIQRSVSDPDEVVRLARTEERALRRWLYTPVGDPESTFIAALESVVAEVEGSYACAVELVHVGDLPRDDRVDGLVAAAREAVVNAAKHAGGTVSVFAECADGGAEVYVRDRGPGFDPDAVPDDRLGLRESVVGRMARSGGTATVRSVPGEGTEVALVLPASLGARSAT